MKMSHGCLIVGAGLLIVLTMIGGCLASTYNGMATGNQAVDAQWSQVENVYQRRNDLIPNIVAAVKGEIGHEHAVFKDVAEAQASVGRITIDPKNVTTEELSKWSQAQAGLGGALQKLMVVSYQNPNIKSNQAFMDLRATLEGTENRIAQERRVFNEKVQEQNNRIVSLSGRLLAGFFGFKERAYFKADEGAKAAPKVDFSK